MNITVYCGSSMGANPAYAQTARDVAAWVARRGHTLVYGGSAIGLMGVLAGTALQASGRVVGIEPQFFLDAGVEQHELTQLVAVETMSERKAMMIELGDAFVALPGGVGTLEEISEIMSRIRLHLTDAPCILVNVDGFYNPLRDMLDVMAEHGFLDPHERAAISFPPDAASALALLEEAGF